MKKIVFRIGILLLFGLLLLLLLQPILPVRASAASSDMSEKDIEAELGRNVSDQLDKLDFSSLDSLVEDLIKDGNGFFGGSSFSSKIKQLLSGEFADGYNNLFSALVNLFFDELLGFVPLLATIAAIAVLSSLINSIKPLGNNGIGELIHFVCFGVIVVLLVKSVATFLTMTTTLIFSIKAQMQVVFPIILTLTTTMGGIMSGRIYQPVVAVLSSFIIQLISTVLIPIFIFAFIFTILSNISSGVKFNKFASFFQSLFKWIIGVVFTVFMAYLSLQGITAGIHDGVSIKTARYAIKSYVPIVGGFLSEGFDFILTSSQIIRSAVGTGGLLLLFATVLVPVLKLIIFSLGLKLVSAITEPICDERISNFISGIAKIIPLLISCILAISFSYMFLIYLVMFSASVI